MPETFQIGMFPCCFTKETRISPNLYMLYPVISQKNFLPGGDDIRVSQLGTIDVLDGVILGCVFLCARAVGRVLSTLEDV